MADSDLSAKAIFSPREMKLYNRWQCLHTNLLPKERGNIPTAVEYEDFQQWLKRQDSGYFSDIFDDITGHIAAASSAKESKSDTPIASVCQHTVHPVAAGRFQSRCPVCTIDMHVKYLHVLSQALEDAGGRPPPSCTLKNSNHQDKVYNAWSKGKVCAVKELLVLEAMAEKEAKWSAKHPDEKRENVQTASKALELYWSEILADASGCVDERPRRKKGSTVKFAQDTDFAPGRPDVYFRHNSPRYEPGKYTVAGCDDHDEDVISEDPEDCLVVDEAEPALESPKSSQDLDKIDDIEDDDGDSDWEDAESDEDGDEYSDEDSEGSCTYWEVDDESSFIVFGED